MKSVNSSLWTTIVVLFLILYSSVFTVQEGQRALLLRLGAIERTATGEAKILQPGLHFKMPLITRVQIFDTRLQTLTVQSSRILTEEQKYVLVDYYIKWRIEDLALYFQRTGGNEDQAQTLLQQQVNDALRGAFGMRTISEMVSGERINVMALLKNSANSTAKNLGIAVADVRIKSIDLPQEVSGTVFARMRTKREQVATQHRADGQAQAEAIRATADAGAVVAVATAQMQAANLRAQGTEAAAQIYAQAYNQSPEFYAFYGSLEAYKTAFHSPNDILVLSPESAFFNYFNAPHVNGNIGKK